MALATVTGIEPSPKADGSHVLKVKNAKGRAATVVIPAAAVPAIQAALQRALVKRAFSVKQAGSLTTGVSLPQLDVEQVATAERLGAKCLCSRTQQIGWVDLRASDETLERLKHEIDVVLASRGKQ